MVCPTCGLDNTKVGIVNVSSYRRITPPQVSTILRSLGTVLTTLDNSLVRAEGSFREAERAMFTISRVTQVLADLERLASPAQSTPSPSQEQTEKCEPGASRGLIAQEKARLFGLETSSVLPDLGAISKAP